MATEPIVTSLDLPPKPVANETVGQVVAVHPFLFRPLLRIPVRCCPMSDGNYSDKPCIPTTTVLDACAIVTGNYNGNGHLFRDREGQTPVPSSFLEPGQYFYVVDHDPSLNYPLFASFDIWVPPPRCDVPDHWFSPQCPKEQSLLLPDTRWTNVDASSRSAVSSAAKGLDGQCLLSGYLWPIEGAHIIPVENALWYTARQVSDQLRHPGSYPTRLSGDNVVHDIRNFITLRADIHRRWDKHTFFFIPFNGSFVLYFIGKLADLYSTQYHFRKASFPERVDPYLLFIRFAIAIFSTLREKTANELPHPRQTKVALKGGGTTCRRRAGEPDDATMEEQDDDVEDVMSGDGGNGDDVSELAGLEDGPKLLVKIFEDEGLELPPDLAAAFIPRDEKIEAAKIAWFEANPQIRQCSEATTGVASGIHFE
ncbi:hypothetical protein NLJ89_g2920 [Agrocybe chaxingu]|uniref:HNH nuclease domain-containing protein n=1 Tax=Agrocybe chaxingu TaxID=84603 RepID=A0A9W8K6D0_9AGAR|nr:hypothetical protein NLJ89_g2920 [Agrocybe chaxingu]